MNCKQIQELLPVYVSRDVEEKRARLIATHLQSCTACAGSAAEYEETRRLLQGFAPPTFSEATYDGIRRQVWREIERKESTAPSLPQLAAGLFRPRLSWAVAIAILAAVSLFAFYFIANRNNERREIAEVQPTASPQRPAPTASNSPSPGLRENNAPYKGTDRNKGSENALAGSSEPTQPIQRRKRFEKTVESQAVAVITPSRSVEPSPQMSASPQNPGSEKILRVEMQTKDPNIRIIWFSPQRTKQDSPGRFSKGV